MRMYILCVCTFVKNNFKNVFNCNLWIKSLRVKIFSISLSLLWINCSMKYAHMVMRFYIGKIKNITSHNLNIHRILCRRCTNSSNTLFSLLQETCLSMNSHLTDIQNQEEYTWIITKIIGKLYIFSLWFSCLRRCFW